MKQQGSGIRVFLDHDLFVLMRKGEGVLKLAHLRMDRMPLTGAYPIALLSDVVYVLPAGTELEIKGVPDHAIEAQRDERDDTVERSGSSEVRGREADAS